MKSKTVTARLSKEALDAIAAIRAWHAKHGVKITTSQAIESGLVQHAATLSDKSKAEKK